MTANPWPDCLRLPRGVAAVLGALHLSEPRVDALRGLTDREWHDALEYCDRSRLTLVLRDRVRETMPLWVRERTDGNAASNLERLRRITEDYRSLAGRLADAAIEFVALKGITHAALLGGRPESRMQYDIDLFAAPDQVRAARDELLALGYLPIEGVDDLPTDHLPAMLRKTAWEWRGDYFDLEIPTPVELHFRFWNESSERLRAPGVEQFWNRRTRCSIAGMELGVLSPADALAYAALHLLKHVLHGNSHPSHVYEIAGWLDAKAEDDAFWNEWRALHTPELRRLEAVAYLLAEAWFGCRMSAAGREETERLPASTRAWFAAFADAPARAPFDSNKDELWLHCTLVGSRRDAWSVARRRLLPANLPLRAGLGYVPESQRTWRRRARHWVSYAGRLTGRVWHHALSLPRTAASGLRFWLRG